jgi:Tfp pilus assembly protein PilF
MKRLREGQWVVVALLVGLAGCADLPSSGDNGMLAGGESGSSREPKLPPQQASQASLSVADRMEQAGDTEAAVDQYERVLALDHENAAVLRRLAILYDCSGKPDKAEPLYQKLARSAPRDATVQNDWGRHYYLAGNYPEAESHFRKALQLDPHLQMARCNLGLVLGREERYTEAFQTFREANLSEADTHCNLGFILWTQNRPDQARHECQVALQLDRGCHKAQELLARIDAPPQAPQRAPQGRTRPSPAAQPNAYGQAPSYDTNLPPGVIRGSDGKLWMTANPQAGGTAR